MKLCQHKSHKAWLPEQEFYRLPDGRLHSWCRECMSAYRREYNAKNGKLVQLRADTNTILDTIHKACPDVLTRCYITVRRRMPETKV